MTELFFSLLDLSMGLRPEFPALGMDEWAKLLEMAKKQSMLGVMMEGLDALPRIGGAPLRQYSQWALATEKIEAASQRRVEASRELSERFAAAGLRSCILKGSSSAKLYPSPLRRQSGDVDIWVEGGIAKVLDFLKKECKVKEIVYHHCDAKFFDDVPVEVHFTPSWMNSYVLNKRFQAYCSAQAEAQFSNRDEALGFSVTTPAFSAVFSMVHIWRHVMDEGVGLRQLMDYAYTLKALPQEEKSGVVTVLKDLHLLDFTAAVMYLMKDIFHLDDGQLLIAPDAKGGAFLLDEVLRGGNFGHYDERNAHGRSEGRVKRTLRKTRRQLRFFSFCPRDVLAAPFFKLWQYCMRRRHGWL